MVLIATACREKVLIWCLFLMCFVRTAADWPGKAAPPFLHAWNMTACAMRGHFEAHSVPPVAEAQAAGARIAIAMSGEVRASSLAGISTLRAFVMDSPRANGSTAPTKRFPIDLFWHLWEGLMEEDDDDDAAEGKDKDKDGNKATPNEKERGGWRSARNLKNRGSPRFPGSRFWSSAEDVALQPTILSMIRSMPETRAVVTEDFGRSLTIVRDFYRGIYGPAVDNVFQYSKASSSRWNNHIIGFLSQWYKVAQCHGLVRKHAAQLEQEGGAGGYYAIVVRLRPDVLFWRRLNLNQLWLEHASVAEDLPGRNWLAVPTTRGCSGCRNISYVGRNRKEKERRLQDIIAVGTPASMDVYAAPKLMQVALRRNGSWASGVSPTSDDVRYNTADMRAATTGEPIRVMHPVLYTSEAYITNVVPQVFSYSGELGVENVHSGQSTGAAEKNWHRKWFTEPCELEQGAGRTRTCERDLGKFCPHHRCPAFFTSNLCGYELGRKVCHGLTTYGRFYAKYVKSRRTAVFGCAATVLHPNDGVAAVPRDLASCAVAPYGLPPTPVDCAVACMGGSNGSHQSSSVAAAGFRPLSPEVLRWMEEQQELQAGGEKHIEKGNEQKSTCYAPTWVYASMKAAFSSGEL